MPSPLRSAFFQRVAQTSPDPDGFEVSHGNGIFLYDQDGNAYIDCISGIAVSALGHHHPAMLRAIQKQADLHLHTMVYGEHIQAPQVTLAEQLAHLLPENLSCTFFTNSGAEAVEGALKVAKKYTSRYKIIACRRAYHGSTAGAESLRSDLAFTSTSRPLVPGIVHIDFNSFDDIKRIREDIAAVIIEPIQGEAGVIVPDDGYLKAVRSQCDQTGTLLIFDEIQTGMGRTGTLWAFEHEQVIPDLLLLAKAFGGGLPLGAFISSREIMSVLAHDPALGHLTTFGGHPLSCATSLEAIRVILEEGLPHKAAAHRHVLLNALQHHRVVREIRGRGLMLALDLNAPELLKPALQAMRKNGLLADWFLFNQQSIRLAPPLVMRDDEMQLMCEKMVASLDTL